MIFAACLAEIFKISLILFIILNKTIRCQMEDLCYQLNHVFLNRNINFKDYRDFLEKKNDVLSFCINAKHEDVRSIYDTFCS